MKNLSSKIKSDDGDHHVEIEMQPKHKKEMLRNVSNNKGYRFSSNKVVGGSILGDIARSLGKKFVKKGANKLLDTIGDRTKHRGLTDGIKNYAVDPLVNFGVDRISGGKMAKGSPEMAEKMARLRGMKKGNTAVSHSHSSHIEGEGILDDIHNTLFKISGGSIKKVSAEIKKLEMDIKKEHESINGGNIYDDIRNGYSGIFNKKLGRKITHASHIEGEGILDDIRNTLFKISGGSMKIGSPEMNKLEMEIKNEHESINGGGIFDDIRNGWNRTFNNKLGRKMKKALTSPVAKKVYKGLAADVSAIGSRLTGLPLGLARGAINHAIDGAAIKKKDNLMVQGGNLVKGVPQVQIRKGAGFTGSQGTRYGGSFKAESRGGSMYAA
jgi:ribosomal protein S6E (S10)